MQSALTPATQSASDKSRGLLSLRHRIHSISPKDTYNDSDSLVKALHWYFYVVRYTRMTISQDDLDWRILTPNCEYDNYC